MRLLKWLLVVGCVLLGAETANAAGGSRSGGDAQSVAPFVLVDPIVVPIINNHRPAGFLIVEVIIDSPDSSTASYVKGHMPRLRDGFIQTLNEYMWFEYKLGKLANPDRIEKRLKAVADWVLGKKETRILFKQVMIQDKAG